MPEFLTLLPRRKALDLLIQPCRNLRLGTEEVDTLQASGRVTARSVVAPEALPAFPRSTVDGYAVIARDTFGTGDTLPAYLSVVGEVPMGGQAGFSLKRGQAGVIHTGGMLPGGADAVVMVEHTQVARPGEVEILKAVPGGENTLHIGEDVGLGEEIIPGGSRLRPAEIGGLMGLGILQVPVRVKPRVGILSSGDEVVSPGEIPLLGQVRDINTYSLSALVAQAGGLPRSYGIIPDQFEALHNSLANALAENDLVIITAGSSASARDLTARVIAEMGKPGVLAHGVNLKPGKPTILAMCNGKPVIGLPGNPLSALVIARLFVVPVIETLLGLSRPGLETLIRAYLTINLPSVAGREDWVPVRLVEEAGKLLAEPIFYKSNLIFNLVQADGLACIPEDTTGMEAGELVQVSIL
jgi:molybdopterin molybdotransferase